MNALMVAAQKGQLAVVDQLLAAGCNPAGYNTAVEPPLTAGDYARRAGHAAIADKLGAAPAVPSPVQLPRARAEVHVHDAPVKTPFKIEQVNIEAPGATKADVSPLSDRPTWVPSSSAQESPQDIERRIAEEERLERDRKRAEDERKKKEFEDFQREREAWKLEQERLARAEAEEAAELAESLRRKEAREAERIRFEREMAEREEQKKRQAAKEALLASADLVQNKVDDRLKAAEDRAAQRAAEREANRVTRAKQAEEEAARRQQDRSANRDKTRADNEAHLERQRAEAEAKIKAAAEKERAELEAEQRQEREEAERTAELNRLKNLVTWKDKALPALSTVIDEELKADRVVVSVYAEEYDPSWETNDRFHTAWIVTSHTKAEGHPVLGQRATSGSSLPQDFVKAGWDDDYYITSLSAKEPGHWSVVMSKGLPWSAQIWKSDATFPAQWVKSQWSEDYAITAAAFKKTESGGNWVVVMTQGTGFDEQTFTVSGPAFPIEFVERHWAEGRSITTILTTNEKFLVVMAKLPHKPRQTYRTKSSWPELRELITERVKEGWSLQHLANEHFETFPKWYAIFSNDPTVPLIHLAK